MFFAFILWYEPTWEGVRWFSGLFAYTQKLFLPSLLSIISVLRLSIKMGHGVQEKVY